MFRVQVYARTKFEVVFESDFGSVGQLKTVSSETQSECWDSHMSLMIPASNVKYDRMFAIYVTFCVFDDFSTPKLIALCEFCGLTRNISKPEHHHTAE